MTRTTLTIAIAVCLTLAAAGTLSGAGFEVAEQSGRLLGSAYAGKAAEAGDASTVFFNPAGMMRLDNFELDTGLHALLTRSEFKDKGSSSPWGSLGSEDGGNPGGLTVVPSLYVVVPVCKDWRVGLGVNAPYGLRTDYEEDWIGRYHALESELMTININPCVAYRASKVFSFGFGVNIQRAEATLSQAVDFGTIGAESPAELTPQMHDGKVTVTGDNWNFGWNAGVLVEFDDHTRLGLSYRSRILQALDGEVDYDVPASFQPILPLTGTMFADQDATARVTLPEQVYLSLYHDINEKWAVLLDVTCTAWKEFDELVIRFEDGSSTTQAYDWKNAFRFSVGAIFRPCEGWTFRAGTAIDQSPIRGEHRTPRIPTSDRVWFTLGAGCQLSKSIHVDASWLHVFIEDGSVDVGQIATGQRLIGKFDNVADVLAVNITIGF